jgi:hypothetical protein
VNRKTIRKIESVTSLKYCDRKCPCGENNRLMWIPSGDDTLDWLPDWINGVEPEAIYQWMLESFSDIPELKQRMIDEEMRLFVVEDRSAIIARREAWLEAELAKHTDELQEIE